MSSLAQILQHIHLAVFDLLGWALPDFSLHEVVRALPKDWQEGQVSPQDIRQWIQAHPDVVHTVVSHAQAQLRR